MRRRPKKADSVPKLVLEDVIGLTTRNADGLASDASSGRCAYLAGCVVVLYDAGTGARKHLMVSARAPKPLSCVALARQGRSPVAAGESGHVPAVLIWDSSTGNLLSELKGHQSGVQSIDFSSDGKSLVSLGYINDGYICLWDWRVGRLITKVKASTTLGPILSVSFLSEGSSFITIGRKHLKLWTLGSLKTLSTNVGKELPSLDGKAANLGCCKGSSFISVACSAWSTKTAASDQVVDWFPLYAVTETGSLCVLDRGISVEKIVDLKVEKGFALSVSENLIACACNSGIVQLFSVPSLLHVGRLDYGESNGQVDLTNMSSYAQPSESCAEHSDTIPDAIACQFLSPTKLAVIYADHSFYIWDIDHTPKISKCCLLVAHSACIWDVQNLPCKNLNKIDPTYESSGYPSEVSMATCSADGTIRLWDLVLHPCPEGKQTQLTLSQQIYNSVDNELAASVQLVSCGILEQENVDKELLAQGFRSMSVSSDGQYVAAGDCRGNLHVFNLHTSEYTCIEEAHDAEILSVNFSNKQAGNNAELEGPFFLVTGSRDRTVHVHNIRGSFDLIESFEDHSAPVTSVILTWDGCKLLSCSADRSILFRDIIITDSGCKVVRRHNQLACHGTIYDMAIDRARKLVVTVGQNKRINKYSLSSGKLVASFKEEGDPGQPIKVAIDPSGSYVLCSYSNKSLRIYDFVTGELVALAMGHAEVVTGSIFLPNCKHIVSVSGDSCIFIWKLPASLSSKMLQKTKENAGCPPTTVATKSTNTLEIAQQKVESAQPNVDSDYCLSVVMLEKEDNGVVDDGSREDSKFMFSISRLPKWAQTKVESKPVISQDSDSIVSSQLSSSQSSNLETVDGHVSSLGSSFCGDSTKNAPRDQEILSCSSEGRIVHFDDIVDLDETDSPEGHCSDTKSFDSFLKVSEELLVEECSGYDVMDTISLDATAKESPTSLSAPEHCKISRDRAELKDEGFNAIKERVEDGVYSVVVEKVLSKRLDTDERPVHSRTAEIGGFTNEFPCDDLFSQHFDNLSTVLKPEGRSSKRKSLSAHFRVRRDCLSSCKRLSLAAAENHGRTACVDLGSGLDPLRRSIEDAPQQDTLNQEKKNDRRLPLSSAGFPQETGIVHLIDTPPSNNSNPSGNGDQMPGSSEGDETSREIDECREALHRLDEAAETALGLCTKLGVLEVTGRQSGGCRTELLSLMADTLPSIMEKVQILANLGQSGNEISGSRYKPEGLDLEPMIERFAESLSHRALELLKTKL